MEGVAEPGAGGQGHGGLAIGLLGGHVDGADGAGDGGVEAVALGEGDPEEVGQLAHVEAVGDGAAESADDLIGARLDELGELSSSTRTHVRIVAVPARMANPCC